MKFLSKIIFAIIVIGTMLYASSCRDNLFTPTEEIVLPISSLHSPFSGAREAQKNDTSPCGLPANGYCTDLAVAKFNLGCSEKGIKDRKDWQGVNNVIAPYWYDNAKAKNWKVSKNYLDAKNKTLVLFGTTSANPFGHVAVSTGGVVKEAITDKKTGKITGYKYMITIVEYNAGKKRISTSKDAATKKADEDCYVKNGITSTYGVETTRTFDISVTQTGFGPFIGYIFPEKTK